MRDVFLEAVLSDASGGDIFGQMKAGAGSCG
jgi:hypothetical protein